MFDRQLARVKATGNAISEFDNWYKLNQINPTACKDRVRGYFGEKHGDWQKANQQAETTNEFLEALSKGEIDFRSAYKAEKELKENALQNPLLA